MDGVGAKDFGGVKLRMRGWVFSIHPKYLDLVLIYLSDLMISIEANNPVSYPFLPEINKPAF
ncbi:MAG TPA: hypothetical protein VEM15_12840 [Thermodesulfobacteriota bacterium]|nr:hypothetical protein [Thermodesulfobacteriota bacterium]